MTSPVPLSFVLLSQHAYPDPVVLVAAAQELGVTVRHTSSNENSMTFDLATGGSLLVGLMPAPHPDAAGMATGPTSAAPEAIQQHVGHYIITGLGFAGGPEQVEVTLCKLTAAVIKASPAVAAMLGSGVVFHKADHFAALVGPEDDIPTPVTVDITAERESEHRMSFLTHGLNKYGREEFYLTAAINGQGALPYLMMLVQWMVVDRDKVLPTGDTVGRTAEEKIVVQRVPSPIPGRPDVIRLDMDTDDGGPKKKGFFRRK